MSDCINIKLSRTDGGTIKAQVEAPTVKLSAPSDSVKLSEVPVGTVKSVLDEINLKVNRECIGVRETPCPVITCIDGGDLGQDNDQFQDVNGLLNGGTL